ncbi:MAG TPA: hypothetical protein VMJ32_16985 [Pirellulales bacterium]|nr:hypothetical protein [Pirellulales bacterium]
MKEVPAPSSLGGDSQAPSPGLIAGFGVLPKPKIQEGSSRIQAGDTTKEKTDAGSLPQEK